MQSCPSSVFTIAGQIPTCMAAEHLRNGASVAKPSVTVGARFKHCFLTGNGAELREMLVPLESMSVDRGTDDDMGFDTFD
jgi:hypothetical protein